MRSTAYQLKAARFPNYRDLAGFDFASSEVNEALAQQLHRCEFLEDAQLKCRPGRRPRTGKTHLATAIGVQAIEHHRKRVKVLLHRRTRQRSRNKRSFRANLARSRHGSAHLDLVIPRRRAWPPVVRSASGGALLFHLLTNSTSAPKRHHHD